MTVVCRTVVMLLEFEYEVQSDGCCYLIIFLCNDIYFVPSCSIMTVPCPAVDLTYLWYIADER